MNSLIKKELREVAVWAGVGALLMLAVIALFIYQDIQFGDGPFTWKVDGSTLYETYKNWMKIGSIVVALGIGLAQIVPELRRDQWAFLIHRPLTLNQIWLAKLIAGVIGYVAATFIPLVIVSIWMDQPHNYPGPFDMRLIVPNLVSILSGFVFYFAAQMVALRPVRWYGSRLLPIFTAGIGALMLFDAHTPEIAILIALAFIVPVAIAAQGSFVAIGEYSGQTLLQRITLGATMAVGAATVVVTLFGIGISWYQSIYGSVGGSKHQTLEQYELYKNGKIVIVDDQQIGNAFDNITQVMDLQGNPLHDTAIDKLLGKPIDSSDFRQSETIYPSFRPDDYASYETYYISLYEQPSGQSVNDALYFSTRDHVIYVFAESDSVFTGYIGADGKMVHELSLAPKFPDGSISAANGLFFFKHAVYNVADYGQYPDRSPSISLIAQTASDNPYVAAVTVWLPGTGVDIKGDIVVQSKFDVSVYDTDGKLLCMTALPQLYTIPNEYLSILIWPNRTHFAVINSGWNEEYDAATARPPLVNPTVTTNGNMTIVQRNASDRQPIQTFASQWLIMSVPLGPVAVFDGGETLWNIAHGNPTNIFGPQGSDFVAQIFWIFVGSLSGTILIIPVARQYRVPNNRLIPWLVCGFLLSWVGILMIVAMRPLPVTITCTPCGRKRGIETLACEHCGHGIDSLAPDGREIFESKDQSLIGV